MGRKYRRQERADLHRTSTGEGGADPCRVAPGDDVVLIANFEGRSDRYSDHCSRGAASPLAHTVDPLGTWPSGCDEIAAEGLTMGLSIMVAALAVSRTRRNRPHADATSA